MEWLTVRLTPVLVRLLLASDQSQSRTLIGSNQELIIRRAAAIYMKLPGVAVMGRVIIPRTQVHYYLPHCSPQDG